MQKVNMNSSKKSSRKINADELADLSDSDLLQLRFKNISLSIAGSVAEYCIERLYAEMTIKNLIYKPQMFLGDE